MWPRAFFGARYFAPRYFPQSAGDVTVVRRQQKPAVWGYVERVGIWGY
jgi:hypothetical protein